MASFSVNSEMTLQFRQPNSTTKLCPIRVTEHLPSFVSRALPVRIDTVTDAEQALHLPWIAKLPGEKCIEPWHGKLVIMQHYLRQKLVRAQIEFIET